MSDAPKISGPSILRHACTYFTQQRFFCILALTSDGRVHGGLYPMDPDRAKNFMRNMDAPAPHGIGKPLGSFVIDAASHSIEFKSATLDKETNALLVPDILEAAHKMIDRLERGVGIDSAEYVDCLFEEPS